MAFRGYGKIKSSCCLHMIYFPIWISHRDVLSIAIMSFIITSINSLRPWPTRRHFADDIFKCIFENENEWISPRISLKFVPKVRINNIPALVQIKALRRQATSHYLNQWWLVDWRIYASLGLNELMDVGTRWCYHTIILSNTAIYLTITEVFTCSKDKHNLRRIAVMFACHTRFSISHRIMFEVMNLLLWRFKCYFTCFLEGALR